MPGPSTPSPSGPVDPARELAARTRTFVEESVIPVESRLGGNVHGGPEDVRDGLQAAAQAEGLFCPQAAVADGGLGLTRLQQSFVLEAAGYSLLGPLALNCAAPDEGNMHLLAECATDDQRERYLLPLVAGAARSCFAMTEPAPGAGSDPAALRTSAVRTADGGWSITGHKWFITGAVGASFTICMARTSGAPGDRSGATMFLVDAGTPGLELERNIGSLDSSFFGGHGELRFTECRVGPDAVLGEVDQGFRYAQTRLAPARLTHCMRWLGIAQRSQDIAVARVADRQAFGSRLGDLGMVQQHIADTEIELTASRALVREAAAALDAGADAGQLSSITKTFVAEAVWRAVDRSLQVCGALGVSEDLPLGLFLREVRPFRIYDGPSETHRWAIAKRVLRQARG
ncbi:MAG: acyl-CoA dehydrogenase [Actinomycetia bacterium]|nr:acyl-CoA dehydrogenase [Actinomycetes bacterium]